MQPSTRPPLAQMRANLERTRSDSRYGLEVAAQAHLQAIAMKEDALDMRLNAWLDRLAMRDGHVPLDMLLQRCLDAAISVASADYGNIQLMHPTRYGLELRAQRGFSTPFLNFFEFVDDGFSACGLALLDRRPIVVADVVSSPIFLETPSLDVLLEAGVRAVQSTPLVGRDGSILGMLSVHHRTPQRHSEADLTRFQTLVDAISKSISASIAPPHR